MASPLPPYLPLLSSAMARSAVCCDSLLARATIGFGERALGLDEDGALKLVLGGAPGVDRRPGARGGGCQGAPESRWEVHARHSDDAVDEW